MATKRNSSSSGETWLVGISSDIYERKMEWTWMTRDDMETFEARIEDKDLFQNIALITLGASIPLGVEKVIDFYASKSPTDMAIVIVCSVFAVIGLISADMARRRRSKASSFKDNLFKNERLTSRTFSMIDTSSDDNKPVRVVR